MYDTLPTVIQRLDKMTTIIATLLAFFLLAGLYFVRYRQIRKREKLVPTKLLSERPASDRVKSGRASIR